MSEGRELRTDTFHLFDIGGHLIAREEIPDATRVFDQQFRRDGNNSWLEVTCNDGFIRDYSARDASVLDERQGGAPDLRLKEEFLTDLFRIARDLRETPAVYDRETGKEI